MASDESVTLRELADRLDVAPSTVSRALAGDGGVGEKKAREIRQLAAAMNYRPRPLRRKISRTIGLIVATDRLGEPDDAFQYDTICEVTRAVAETEWHIHIDFLDRRAGSYGLPAVLRANRADGLILSGSPPADFCRMLRQNGVPTVVLQDTVERTGLSSVIPDVGSATETAVRHLIEMGHRQISLVTCPTDFPTVRRRYEAYQRAVRSAGLEVNPALEVKVASSALHQGQSAMRQLLASSQRPTAIVFATDRLAIGGLWELARAGLRIPEDISVLGHDNSTLARESDPPITSVDLNFTRTAELAVKMLQESIVEGLSSEPRQCEVPCQVVWRASCGPAAIR